MDITNQELLESIQFIEKSNTQSLLDLSYSDIKKNKKSKFDTIQTERLNDNMNNILPSMVNDITENILENIIQYELKMEKNKKRFKDRNKM